MFQITNQNIVSPSGFPQLPSTSLNFPQLPSTSRNFRAHSQGLCNCRFIRLLARLPLATRFWDLDHPSTAQGHNFARVPCSQRVYADIFSGRPGWSQVPVPAVPAAPAVLELADLAMQTRQGIHGWPLSSSLEVELPLTHCESDIANHMQFMQCSFNII